jgi:glycosyltransferase involved in cell wall biosynthesis
MEASELPTISVVVFVLNAAKTIDHALRSVTTPDQPPVELVIMDGGSTDGTVDVIRSYEKKIAFWRSHRDGGAIVALNDGVSKATGDIICLLPGDDWVEPGALHLVRERFARDPDLDVLSCGTRFAHHDPDGTLRVDQEFTDPGGLELTMKNLVRCPLTAGRFVRRRMYVRLGNYDSSYEMSNDLDFLIRVCLQRPKTAVLPHLVYTYRVHEQSRTLSGNSAMVFQMMRDNIRVAATHLRSSPLRSEERTELKGLHGRNSARFAWMLLVKGEIGRAAGVLYDAIRVNRWWPLQVWYWIGCRVLRGAKHA